VSPTEPDHPYQVLDVFTDTPLQGNPLAVFTEGEQVPSRLMQRTARELNLSETVFLLPGDGERYDAEIRIFTPAAELPFAGHPTLGSAFVVAERDELATVRLKTGAGIVPVRLTREHGELTFGEMDQPIPTVRPYEGDLGELMAVLGASSGASTPVEQYANGPTHTLVTLADADELARLSPDLNALKELGVQAAVVALTGDQSAKTRNFAPSLGVPEDPATGSAAGPIALHLARHGLTSFGATVVLSQGAEIGRPSTLHARVEGSHDELGSITVGGGAVVVARGAFRLQ
jgi:trans-2,3-dihydro-3-hydroxyanthranilate isomerase